MVEVASKGVAHLSRGDSLILRTASGTMMRVTPQQGSDPFLRFLALIEAKTPITETETKAVGT